MYSIHLAEQKHYNAIFQIYKPFVTDTIISFETLVPPKEEFNQRIDDTLVDLPWLVCLLENEVIGYAYASKYRKREAYKWSAEVSVYIDPSYRRRNIATGLYTSLFSILELQNYKNLLAGISLPNEVSVFFHESMEFKKIAEYEKIGYKFGKWHSVGWWQKSIGQKISAPEEPILIQTLVNSDQFKMALNKGVAVVNNPHYL